jgi:membrane-associated phospholipid phosphatase
VIRRKDMKKSGFLIMLLCVVCIVTFGQESGQIQEVRQTGKTHDGIVPLSLVFHNIGWNTLHSITYNYGLNFIGAGVGTWVFVETGLDWKWRNVAYENDWLSSTGIPGLYVGYVVPGLAPAAAYIIGLVLKDEKLQITGLALAQSFILTFGIQSILKMSTGRALPGIVNELDHTRSSRTDDFSGEFSWFNMNFIGGWPSGHTANAFMAAATVSEIYHDNLWLKIGVYTYASLIGFGKSVSVHWASEVFAGALIGYAIGKTVGRSYRKLLENNENIEAVTVTLYGSYNTLGVIIRL